MMTFEIFMKENLSFVLPLHMSATCDWDQTKLTSCGPILTNASSNSTALGAAWSSIREEGLKSPEDKYEIHMGMRTKEP